jgi:hypothetical protein
MAINNAANYAITQYSVLTGNANNLINNVAAVATGQVLISSGVSAQPAWSATPTVTSITFGAGTALSTYAEGTFTPTMTGNSSAGTTTYSSQTGFYTRIGNIVYYLGITTGSAATGTGAIKYAGFPFTIKNQVANNYGQVQFFSARTWPSSRTMINFLPQINTTFAYIESIGSGQGQTEVTMQNIAFNDQFNGVYQI